MSITYKQKRALKRGKLEIKGGWIVKIPEVLVAEEDKAALIKYWIARGKTHRDAEKLIWRTHNRIHKTRYMMELREWIGRKAEKYNEMFPHLELEGFRPEIIARMFVPGRDVGGVLDSQVVQVLTAMGRMVEDARDDENDQG